jgi:hypothetical protein
MRDAFGIYPDYERGWNMDGLFIKRDVALTDPTFSAFGIESGGTGSRCDLQIWDDVLTTENQMSDVQRESIRNIAYTSVFPITDDGGQVLIIGTRKHIDDMYGYLLKSDRWRQKQYKAIINEEEKRVLWPEKWNYEKLMGIRDDYVKQFGPLGLLYFRQEYQNEAVALGGEEFKEEWLLHYTDKPRFIKDLPRFMFVDPAMGLKPQASYTAIVTVAFGQDSGRFWVLEFFRGKYGYGDLPNIIASKANQWNPLLIGIESAFWQRQLADFFPKEMRVVPFDWRKHGLSGQKEDRIRMLQPYFMARRIELPPASDPMTDIFITQEYLPFPAGMTTDFLDALNGAIHLAPLKSQRFIKKWI